MAQYLLSIHGVTGEERPARTNEQMQEMGARIGALEEEMKSAGAWVFSARLHGPETATVVQHSDGELMITDGPFAESKEYLGGFWVIQAPDLDAALAWAKEASAACRGKVEVRPFQGE
jgi:hypothetical protein